jgi:hypothetical protein
MSKLIPPDSRPHGPGLSPFIALDCIYRSQSRSPLNAPSLLNGIIYLVDRARIEISYSNLGHSYTGIFINMALRVISTLFATTLVLATSQNLFPFEQQQLTREYVASLPEEDALLFAFGDEINEIDGSDIVNNTEKRCRYDPTHKKWPSEKALNKLRKQLSSQSALIATVPQASVCYGATKSDTQCQAMASNWTNSYTHIEDPTEVLSPLYQGLTCQPPSVYDSKSCTLGGYPSYVIKAQTVSDIQSGINFARNDFLRLVVKNTGHDFAGKSAGYGAFSIWTHNLKDMQYFDNYVDDSGYKGPAIKAGAGVQAFELYKFANERNVVAVAGEGQAS